MRALLSIFLLAAVMTTSAMLTIGSLNFVGLMAPHMALMLGFHKPVAQGMIAPAIGGFLIVHRLVQVHNDVPQSNLRRIVGNLYWRTVLFHLAAVPPGAVSRWFTMSDALRR
ncbi:hypothetical protein BG74_04830 [Sodalis-like endosymbiont of Proechinophthirus fluctus]|nr:hypothetical protein BG74_04830 [Sodalis-like endosymbiont of Proechinophthirus fluctus]